jgi:hypothetical protein
MGQTGLFTRQAWWVTWLVIVHFVVVLAHTAAHLALGITPSVVETVFIVIIIDVIPIAMTPFVWRGSRAALAILALAFAVAWLYGMVNHFILEGVDHVVGLDHGAWQATFTVTGVLLLVLEAAGMVLAAWLFWRASVSIPRQAPAQHQ